MLFITLPLLIYPDITDNVPAVRVTASVSDASGDGFYHIDSASSAVLDPPVDYFYDSFNAINWTIAVSCFNSSSGDRSYVHVTSVIEEFSPVRVAGDHLN